MSNSRRKNAILNIIVGIASQCGILLLSFVGRRIFLYYLSVDYLGINGLYSNILSVLALAELGLGNVTQFFLYKPVAENNEGLISYLVRYFRKLYSFIAGAVLVLGIALIPFLKFIVNSDLTQNELIIYYILFLMNSVVSYFSADKQALLAAYQDNRLQRYVLLATNIFAQIAYIVVLVIWHSYIFYVSVTLLSSIINVIVINSICTYKYPYLKNRLDEVPKEFNKSYILENIKSTFVYKIGATVVNNTDNILISVMISTAAVGLYSNYYMVVMAVQSFIAIVTTSLISGIGNLSATGNKKRLLEVFDGMQLFYHFIAAAGGISFFFLFDELIEAWLGARFVLGSFTVFAIVISFYQTNVISPIWMFREANGLFGKVKYLLLITAGINVICSIGMGKIWGMAGILLATSIARGVTQLWYEPKILFKNVFNISTKRYWLKQARYMTLTLLSALICWGVSWIAPHGFGWLLIKLGIYFGVCFIVFILGMIKTEEFFEMKRIGKALIMKIKYNGKG